MIEGELYGVCWLINNSSGGGNYVKQQFNQPACASIGMLYQVQHGDLHLLAVRVAEIGSALAGWRQRGNPENYLSTAAAPLTLGTAA